MQPPAPTTVPASDESDAPVRPVPAFLQKTRRLLPDVLRWLCILLPAWGLLELIREFRVNIPFLDDWMFVYMFEEEKAGTLSLSDYFIVQMEHRMAFVRACMMTFHRLWPTDWTKPMFFSWVLLALTQVNVGLLLRQTAARPFRQWWPLLAIAGLLIFTPVQYRIVLWSMMFQVACPAFFLSTALVALGSRQPLWLRWIIGVLCASCATQTFATGLLVWLLPLPLMLWGGIIAEKRTRFTFTALWLAATAVTFVLYFTDLKNQVDPAFAYKQGEEETLRHDLSGFFTDPGRSVPYVLRFLGNHFARGMGLSLMDASFIAGLVSLLLFLAFTAYGLWHWKREDLRQRLMPWVLFGAYSVGAGILVAMGRMWASPTGENAITARYVIHAVPLTVSLCVLAWMIVNDMAARRVQPTGGTTARHLLQGGGIALVCFTLITWTAGWRLMEMWHSSRLRGSVNTRFYKFMHHMPDPVPGNRNLACRADDLGLLDPPMLKDAELDNFRRITSFLNGTTARLRSLEIIEEDGFHAEVRGFACLSSRVRVADGVFIARRLRDQGRWEIIQVAQVMGLPMFLLETLGKDSQFVHTPGDHISQDGISGFTARFPVSLLPAGVHEIAAWVCNAEKNTVQPMLGFFLIDNRGPVPRVKRLGSDPSAVHLETYKLPGKSAPARKPEP